MCATGGQEAVDELKAELKENGYDVLDATVLTTSCNDLLTKKELKPLKEAVEDSDLIVSLACGNGVQTLAKLTGKRVVPSNNTLFVGERIRGGVFEETCRTCGACVLGRTAAICPVSRCSKGLLNGPCGGSIDGYCEVDPELKCAWIEIYNRLKEDDRLDLLEEVEPIRSYINVSHPRKLNRRGR